MKLAIAVVSVAVFLCAIPGCDMVAISAKSAIGMNKPSKWERGWKTSRVVAEYLPDTHVGYSLKFTFPQNYNDADREEISDTFADFDCSIYQGGGYPGAPAYVSCEGVGNNTAADAKLKNLIPALDDVLTRMELTSGPLPKSKKTLAREAALPKTHAEWIAVQNTKKEKCDGDGWRGSSSNGFESYTKECKAGIIVYRDTTEETHKMEAEENAHKADLANALVTRCLNAKEFKEVTGMGYYIYTRNMTPFREEDLQSRFNAALQTQQILRMNCPKVESK